MIDTWILEQKAKRGFSFIEKFIRRLEKTKDKAEKLKESSNEQIAKLKQVNSSCDRVKGFTEKLLKAVK